MRNLTFLICVLLCTLNICGQKKERILIYDRLCSNPASASRDKDSDCLVELVDLRIGDDKIISGKPFTADENWLKDLRVKVRNVSGKPFVFIQVAFGLMAGLNDELGPSESWAWGFGFFRGKYSDPLSGVKPSKEIVLKPNEVIELSFVDSDASTNEMLNKHSFQKAVFRLADIQFKNGTLRDSYFFSR